MLTRFLLRTYDYFAAHRKLCWVLLLVVLCVALFSLLRLNFREDIADFLPRDRNYKLSVSVYQRLNAADRIFFLFQLRDTTARDPQRIVEAIEYFTESADSAGWEVSSLLDFEKIEEVRDFVYENAPLLLSESDYERMEQKMYPDSVRATIERDKTLLLFPVGGFMSQSVAQDPLDLFSPLFSRLFASMPTTQYEMHEGYVFSPDDKFALAVMHSPFGASETNRNTEFLQKIRHTISHLETEFPDVQIHLTGVPVVSVDNAQQIKKDGILALAIATLLILPLLFYMLRRLRYLLLILLSLAFGWLIALAAMAWGRGEVSLIVLGIASVISGIAVNYPLHFLSHLAYKGSPRAVLADIVEPLVIGNVTTVGAFAALIPLDSTALCDLGLFAAFMLVGTILFVVFFLPHFVGKHLVNGKVQATNDGEEYIPKYPRNKFLIGALLTVTLVLGYFSLSTEFDTDVRNINYLTNEQKELLTELASLKQESTDSVQVYYTITDSTINAALERAATDFPDILIAGIWTQEERLERWNKFVERHRDVWEETLPQVWKQEGFLPCEFENYRPSQKRLALSDFSLLREVGVGNRIVDSTVVVIKKEAAAEAGSLVVQFNEKNPEHYFAFNVQSMNSAVARLLADNFNYIGFVCGAIVFLFLWISFRKLRYALIAFLPMLVSWLWILGTMHLLDMRFNLVNIILATFIFGQGDDYSIFITEGLIYEYTYHRRMLAHYKRSIFFSAAIMFIGMGSLIVASHPALRGLGEITIVGMASVVVLTYIIPPLVFGLFVRFWATTKK